MEQMTHKEAKEKAKELVSQMTLAERASQLSYRAAPIPRLGIPFYNWWNEGLHGVARAGTATVFPQAIALAATFDDKFVKKIADVISTEGRAKYNEYIKKEDRDIYKGLTYWSPNINIFRDPRWGRGHETYGEDPYLTSRMGVSFVKGLQGDGKYLKLAACAKHFAVHSGPENLRHEFDAQISLKDLYETYLPAFEACVKEADVESVMGAYNRVNGEPCNGSKTLLQDILRDQWGFEGHVVSDCGAIADFHMHHRVTKTAEESAALAIRSGCDLNCGNIYIYLMLCYQEGLITEEDITRAAERLMATRYRLGMFDENCEYNQIPYEINDCAEHNMLSLEAAKKSMVLLKNDGILPLDKKKIHTLAVIGPNADSKDMLNGNYNGTASRYITLLEGIYEAVEDTDIRVLYSEGCHLYMNAVENGLAQQGDRESEAVSVAERADAVVLCLGLDARIEGEEGDPNNPYASGDKSSLNLPGRQQILLERVLATGKPVIVVLGTGSALTLQGAEKDCAAIINAWYPGSRGGRAFAQILFGEVSPSGKLPVTFYKTTEELPEFTDYSMKNRTYRYMEQEALYPFGYGLTYSKVELSDLKVEMSLEQGAEVKITIANVGDFDIEEVVQCYLKDLESPFAVKNYSLCAFERVPLKKGEKKTVVMQVKPEAFCAVMEDGTKKLDSRHFCLYAGISQPDHRSEELTHTPVLKKEIEF